MFTVVWFKGTKAHGYHEVNAETPQVALREVSALYQSAFIQLVKMFVYKGTPFRDYTKYAQLISKHMV